MAPLGLDPDLLKTIGSFAGAGLGAFTGIYAKELLERTRLKGEELQTRWLPLLTAAEELEEKLHALALVYANPGEGTWNGERWNNRPLPRLARDFIELFLLEENVGQVNSFDGLRPSERRGNRDSVLRARARIHELNGATTAMYRPPYISVTRNACAESWPMGGRGPGAPCRRKVSCVSKASGVRSTAMGTAWSTTCRICLARACGIPAAALLAIMIFEREF
jgi:hypothetical protein